MTRQMVINEESTAAIPVVITTKTRRLSFRRAVSEMDPLKIVSPAVYVENRYTPTQTVGAKKAQQISKTLNCLVGTRMSVGSYFVY